MCSFIVVVLQPDIRVSLKFIEPGVDTLAECHLVKLLKNGLVEPLADTLGLWVADFGLDMLDII